MIELNHIYNMDCISGLKLLDDESVNCCVTSPPYWGLRDYGTAKWEGGDINCDHRGKPMATRTNIHDRTQPQCNNKPDENVFEIYKDICGKCGAIRIDKQFGLEETPEQYVANMVDVFREVKRVLRKDGNLWLNLGDSYAGSGKGRNGDGSCGKLESKLQQGNKGSYENQVPSTKNIEGLKPKDLCGIPWRVAFALQLDGWYLRQDIIWCISGGAYLYVKSQKGVMPMMVRDMARLKPSTINLWNGTQWTQVLGMSRSERRGDELEIVLRSGERISCTPTHKFLTNRGLIDAGSLRNGDILETCVLPDVESPRDCVIDEDAAWFAGLYIAEGSHSGKCIQIAGNSKEIDRWERINKIATKYGGSCTRTIDGNQMNIRVYGKILNAIIEGLVTGKLAKSKGFSPSVWKYSNKFIASMLDGYLSGDGHFEADNNRWRLGFTRNYNLERDLRTACARLGYHLVLNMSTVKYNGKYVPTFRGELRKERSGHHNEKNTSEIMEIRKARCREVYDICVKDEPHIFALASGILTHNSKPNPMPESVTDRCTKSHEYIFLLSKSANYYYDNEAIKEKAIHHGQIIKATGNKSKNSNLAFGGDTRSGFVNNDSLVKEYSNKRDVWTVTTKPFKEAHFATFPEDLIKPCILAGCPEQGIVLDPFMGAGTTALVAIKHQRNFIGFELNKQYVDMAETRIKPYLEQQSLFEAVK